MEKTEALLEAVLRQQACKMTKSYAAMPVSRVSSDAQLPMEIAVDADKPTAISLMKYFFETSLFRIYTRHIL